MVVMLFWSFVDRKITKKNIPQIYERPKTGHYSYYHYSTLISCLKSIFSKLQVEVLYLHSFKHMFLPSLSLVFIFFTYI
jgi:hypothetical protein